MEHKCSKFSSSVKSLKHELESSYIKVFVICVLLALWKHPGLLYTQLPFLAARIEKIRNGNQSPKCNWSRICVKNVPNKPFKVKLNPRYVDVSFDGMLN